MDIKESAEPRLTVRKLQTETLDNPLGIDINRPYLSWQINSSERNVYQSAYQVQVAYTADQLAAGENLLWNSLKIFSSNTTSIQYGGPECGSTRRCFWRVRVWDQQDCPSSWSEPAWWKMGLLDKNEWTADWIEVDWEEDPTVFHPCPYFRRGFTLNQPVVSARLYITAHGLYEAWLNGQRVGDQVFTPGFTPYDQRLQYQVYDVSAMLQQGENALGAILGDGWYRGRVYGSGSRNSYGTRLGLLAQLQVEMADGQVVIIRTDSNWKAATGPILKSDMKDGEVYDARLEMPGWCSAGFNDGAWKGVRTLLSHRQDFV